MDYREDSPEILLDFLSYHETIKAHSQRTVDEYYLDLRNFFRYLKWTRDPALQEQPMESVDVRDVDLTFVGSVTLTEIYAYMSYLSRDRVRPVRQGTEPHLPGQEAGHHPLLLWVSVQQGPQAGPQPGEGHRRAQAEKDPAPLSDAG